MDLKVSGLILYITYHNKDLTCEQSTIMWYQFIVNLHTSVEYFKYHAVYAWYIIQIEIKALSNDSFEDKTV